MLLETADKQGQYGLTHSAVWVIRGSGFRNFDLPKSRNSDIRDQCDFAHSRTALIQAERLTAALCSTS